MATFNKFDVFIQNMGNGAHNLSSNVLKVVLSNTLPLAANAVLADITQISAGNGYSSGGNIAASNTFVQTSGVGRLRSSNIIFTASGGSIGPFRYAVLYDSTPSGGPLIGWADYGSAFTVLDGNSFVVRPDATNGFFTVG